MARYRKKPVEIDAFRWDGKQLAANNCPDWIWTAPNLCTVTSTKKPKLTLCIETLEGEMAVIKGDWIIRGVAGELYPCKDAIFAATYDPVDTEAKKQWKALGRK